MVRTMKMHGAGTCALYDSGLSQDVNDGETNGTTKSDSQNPNPPCDLAGITATDKRLHDCERGTTSAVTEKRRSARRCSIVHIMAIYNSDR